MGQPRILEIKYQEFLVMLRHATNSMKKIDISDKERWNNFVRAHNVPEAGLGAKAKSRSMSGKIKAVIIEGDGKADGYYVYSADDVFCLKYDLGLE
jgi:hypothetical protein